MKNKEKETIKFTAMSKLIGIIVFVFTFAIILYSMYEMHRLQDLSALPNLIVGVFAIMASYIGFYINMAKAEHIEDKKNQIKKELELIRLDGITDEEKERELELEHELEDMNESLDELNTEEEIKYE